VILAQEELFRLGKFVVFAAQWVCGKTGPVLFIFRQRGNVVDAIGKGRRAFVWRIISYEVGTAARDRSTPVAGVLSKLCLLGRVDMVANDAGEHGVSFSVMPFLKQLIGVNASATVEV